MYYLVHDWWYFRGPASLLLALGSFSKLKKINELLIALSR